MLTNESGFDIIVKRSREAVKKPKTIESEGPWKLNNERIYGPVIPERIHSNMDDSDLWEEQAKLWKKLQSANELRRSGSWDVNAFGCLDTIFREFDPGSGRTLAACLTHASRTDEALRGLVSGERVSNAWGTCLSEGDNSWKRLLIPHNVILGHPLMTKDLSLKDGLASD